MPPLTAEQLAHRSESLGASEMPAIAVRCAEPPSVVGMGGGQIGAE